MEIWKNIDGFNGLYKISSLGRVSSLKFNKIKYLKTSRKNNYKSVSLYKNGKKRTYQVHRLVALAFLKKIKNKNIVNHIDENIENNNFLNLEWCNHSENIKHKNAINRMIKSRK